MRSRGSCLRSLCAGPNQLGLAPGEIKKNSPLVVVTVLFFLDGLTLAMTSISLS